MAKIFQKITDLIGGTPLLELTHIEQEEKLEATLLGKAEFFNPAGSVKDRIAKAMLDEAEAKGLITPGKSVNRPPETPALVWLLLQLREDTASSLPCRKPCPSNAGIS